MLYHLRGPIKRIYVLGLAFSISGIQSAYLTESSRTQELSCFNFN